MKICIIGAFGFDMIEKTTGGQPVKTRQLFYTLTDHYGKENITYIETYGWKSHPIQMLTNIFHEAQKSDVMIMLPAHNGVQIFARLLVYCKKKYGIRIFYDVIGGWLHEKLHKDGALRKKLMKFDGLWVETSSMMISLVSQGFKNVSVIPNFKNLVCLDPSQFPKEYSEPYKVCTFSRVTEKKGIEEAICCIQSVNCKYNRKVYELDIYGQVDENYESHFYELLRGAGECVNYKGVVSPSESVNILKDYFALLFPTKFYTEGIPGTIIDAYTAGVPIITSLWCNAEDVFEEGVTGWGYEFGNSAQFEALLDKASQLPNEFLKMKESCLIRSHNYHPDNVIKKIDSLILLDNK